VNLFLAVILQQLAKRGDGCTWYFVNMVMDTSIGITLCYLIHLVIERIAVKYEIDALKSGLYFTGEDKPTDDNIDYRVWAVQLVVWCIIVLLVKLILFVIQLYWAETLEFYGEYALSDFKGNPRLELLFVMVVLPLSLNSAQYWMQDNFLMGNKHMEERAERLAELEQFRMVENDFVMVDPDAEGRAIEKENVKQRLNRQIEEGVYNIKP
jgi:STIMATE family